MASAKQRVKLDLIDSTNIYAKRLALEGAAEGTLVTSKNQSGGKGRLGRSFFCYDGGLYMSIVLRPEISPNDSLLITTAAAVTVAEVLEREYRKKCEIKWVNDIYIGGKKVCGILTEGGINPQSGDLDYAVLGIGINLGAPEDGFPQEISDIADSVCEGNIFEREISRIAELICKRFFEIYYDLSSKKFLKEYRRRSFLIGKEISYFKDDTLHTAKVLDVDQNAGLVISEGGSTATLRAGEVSVKW